METKEYYGGTYPEPPESKEKQYLVQVKCSCLGHFFVYAKNEEEAKKKIENIGLEECNDRFFSNYEIEDIVKWEVYDDND